MNQKNGQTTLKVGDLMRIQNTLLGLIALGLLVAAVIPPGGDTLHVMDLWAESDAPNRANLRLSNGNTDYWAHVWGGAETGVAPGETIEIVTNSVPTGTILLNYVSPTGSMSSWVRLRAAQPPLASIMMHDGEPLVVTTTDNPGLSECSGATGYPPFRCSPEDEIGKVTLIVKHASIKVYNGSGRSVFLNWFLIGV